MHVQLSLELFTLSPENLTNIVLLVLTWWVNTRGRR